MSRLVAVGSIGGYRFKMASSDDMQGGFHTVDEGPFAGWQTWVGSPFETLIGPFYWHRDADGTATGAFVPQRINTNYVGILHGGAIMAFADAATSSLAHFATDGPTVTVAFNCEFLGTGVADTPIYASGRVLRETKSMVFVQGQLDQNDEPILAFSSASKKLKPR